MRSRIAGLRRTLCGTTCNQVSWRFCLLLLGIATVPAAMDLALRLWLEIRGIEVLDESVYWGMGRGILNGLMPYVEMYDEKPPGIFLIAALSLWLTNGRTLADVLQAVALGGIALMPVLYLVRSRKESVTVRSAVLLFIVFGACVYLAHFAAIGGGGFQTESFGAFFGTLYVVIIATRQPLSRLRMVLASMAMLCTIGLKEPFLFSLAAAAIFLAETPRSLVRTFIIPLLLSLTFGIVIIGLLGWLLPYISIYLPAIFSVRIATEEFSWLQIGTLNTVLRFITAFYRFNAPLAFLLGICTLYAMFFRIVSRKRALGRFLMLCGIALAWYLVLFATFLGGARVYEHHFLLSVPPLIALLLIFAREMHPRSQSLYALPVCLICAVLLLAANAKLPYTRGIEMRLESDRSWTRNGVMAARNIDAMLDACAVDRYLFLGKHGPMPYAYSTHSPLGPFFFQFGYFLGKEYPRSDRFVQQVASADIVVMHHSKELGERESFVSEYLATHFSGEPWACAAKHASLPGYTVLFRTIR